VEKSSFVGCRAHELIFVDVSPAVLTVAYVPFAAVVIVMFVMIPPRHRRLFLTRRMKNRAHSLAADDENR